MCKILENKYPAEIPSKNSHAKSMAFSSNTLLFNGGSMQLHLHVLSVDTKKVTQAFSQKNWRGSKNIMQVGRSYLHL